MRWWWPPISTSVRFGISYLKEQNVGRRPDEMSKKCCVRTKYSKESEQSYMVLQWQNTSNINERGWEETFKMLQRCSHKQIQCLSVTPPITVNSQPMSYLKKGSSTFTSNTVWHHLNHPGISSKNTLIHTSTHTDTHTSCEIYASGSDFYVLISVAVYTRLQQGLYGSSDFTEMAGQSEEVEMYRE